MNRDLENDTYNPTIRSMSSQRASAKQPEERAEQSQPLLEQIKGVAHLRRTRCAIGLIFGLFGVYLLIACMSFFYTGAVDQSEVVNNTVLQQDATSISNKGAIFGAYLSHIFVEDGVGIAALIIVVWSLILAYRLLFNKKVFFLSLTFLSLFSVVTMSMVLGAVTFNLDIAFFKLGGNIGYYVNKLLYDYTAIYGMVMVNSLLAVLWVFVFYKTLVKIYRYTSDNLQKVRKTRTSKSASEEEVKVKLDDFMGDDKHTHRKADNQIPKEEVKPEVKPIIVDEPKVTEPVDMEPVVNQTDTEEELELVIDYGTNKKPESQEPLEQVEMVISETKEIEKGDSTQQDVYDPTKELSKFKLPKLDLLKDFGSSKVTIDIEEQEANKELITQTLLNYGIEINSIKATVGPTITLFEIVPKEGVRIQKIKSLEDDIALSLAAKGIRIIAPVPGKGTVGIEVPNREPQVVSMRSVLESKAFQNSKASLPIALGCNVSNEVVVADMAKMPHLLVAGATGQGKSVGLNVIITSMLYKKHPAELKFVLIDPKMVEFSLYSMLERHYLAKLPDEEKAIITKAEKVVPTLNSLVEEMEERYRLLEMAYERNIKDYNARFMKRELNPNKGHKYMPYIVLIIDEFSDLIMQSGKEIETPLVRLAQKARAIGIHVILATQRPDAKTITGLIRANFPSRIAFRVSQMQDSRIIIDCSGAQHLIGKGDMLFSSDGDITRLQCAFVDTPEVAKVCDFIGEQIGYSEAYPLPEPPMTSPDEPMGDGGAKNPFERDSLFEEALQFIAQSDYASTSSLQRRFGIGYNRAGRIMDQIEAAGIVSASQGGKPRKVLMTPSEIDMFLGR